MNKTCTRKPTQHRCFRWGFDEIPDWFEDHGWQMDREDGSDVVWYREPDGTWSALEDGDWVVEYEGLGMFFVYDEHEFADLFELDADADDPPIAKLGPGGDFVREIR